MKHKTKIGLPLSEIHGKLAVHKAVKDDDYKTLNSLLSPGTHSIDVSCSIEGELKKGKPFTQRFPAKVNPWSLVAKLMGKVNATTLEAVVRESLEVNEDEAEAVKATAQQAIERLVASTEQEVSGKLTANLVLRLL